MVSSRSLFVKFFICVAYGSIFSVACSSNRVASFKTQRYAPLKSERTFEYDLPVVWKGVENVFRQHAIKDRSADNLQKSNDARLETDWSYSESRDKYVEYMVNGSLRKKYLPIRFKQKVRAFRVLGGTHVEVEILEEVEKLKKDGTSEGYTEVDRPDSSRANETLDRIGLSLLSAAP